MIGIGMVLIATMAAEVSGVITPLLAKIIPTAMASALCVLCHPLHHARPAGALPRPAQSLRHGRGADRPLKGLMPVGAIMAAFTAVGMIQGVCDPTNTQNVWIANYTDTDVQDVLKRTLPYMWALAFLGLILSAVLYYGGVVK